MMATDLDATTNAVTVPFLAPACLQLEIIAMHARTTETFRKNKIYPQPLQQQMFNQHAGRYSCAAVGALTLNALT
jgi:hypothetical protein